MLPGKRKIADIILRYLKDKSDFAFFETGKCDPENTRSYLFHSPREIVATNRLASVKSSLEKINDYLKRGYYAAGFISYEAGYAFEDRFRRMERNARLGTLLRFGIYNRPYVYYRRTQKPSSFFDGILKYAGEFHISEVRRSLNKQAYQKKVIEIKRYIKEGKTYQTNLTFDLKFGFDGDPFGLYLALKSMQPVPYSVYMQYGQRAILSLSPELFIRMDGRHLMTRPMKGTWARGFSRGEQRENKDMFRASQKDRSENIMIVDLLRNDLNRISCLRTVKASRVFAIEEYPTLFQMTSTVSGKLKSGAAMSDVFLNMFPSGSVTGAPKISTMEIIRKLERRPRGIYTGSIGFLTPKRRAVFNIAIRTLVIDRKAKKGSMGIGSGIVIDSDPEREFEECGLKSQFLEGARRNFDLFETILWSQKKHGGYFLLKEHLERLRRAAAFFGYPFSRKMSGCLLTAATRGFKVSLDYKIKLTLDKSGFFRVKSSKLSESSYTYPARVSLAAERVNSKDIFLFFKTTRRELFNRLYKEALRKGCCEKIFLNEKGEVTEGCISNVFIKRNNRFYTPPISSGLLGGVYRKHFLKIHKKNATEKILTVEDLKSAEAVYLVNSVRGMRQVELVGN